jgi:hypothetical protein
MNAIKLSCVALAFALCCRAALGGDESQKRDFKPDDTIKGGGSSELLIAVISEWRGRCKEMGPQDAKAAHGKWLKELETVISSRVPKDQMNEFVLAATANVTAPNSGSWYHRATVEALAVVLSKRGERDALVKLLSRAYPDRIYYGDVEFWVAYQARDTLPDGILLLCKAFRQSNDPKVRAKIAASLSRAFRANGLDMGDDGATVDACESWYSKNKETIKPNIAYDDNRMHPNRTRDHYAKTPLFISK